MSKKTKQNDEDNSLRAARAVKQKAYGTFQKLGKVNGVGLTRQNDIYAVRVNLEEQLAEDAEVPKEIDGVPIVIKIVGKVSKQ